MEKKVIFMMVNRDNPLFSFINFQFWISFIYISYETPQAETCEQEDLTTICIVKTTEGFLALN